MKERFFFDRVYVQRNDLSVYKAVKRSLLIFAYGAYSSFAVLNNAIVCTKMASDICAFEFFIYHGLFHEYIISGLRRNDNVTKFLITGFT